MSDPLVTLTAASKLGKNNTKVIRKGLDNYMAQDGKYHGVERFRYTDFAKLLVSKEKDDQQALKRLVVQKPLKTCKNKRTRRTGPFASFGVPFDIYAEASLNVEGQRGGLSEWKYKTRYTPKAACGSARSPRENMKIDENAAQTTNINIEAKRQS